MLTTLTVKNFAIIDNITIDFSKGFTVLTGETGAGKSLIIDAIGLLFGNRASPSMIRTGFNKAIVEGVFEECSKKVKQLLETYGIDELDDDIVVIKREINDTGKSITRINGLVVTLNQLEQLANMMADIHTQNDTKKLFDVNNYVLFMEDKESLKILEDYSNLLKEYKETLKKYEELKKSSEDDLANLDFLKFRRDELVRADLKIDEVEQIEQELYTLNNFETIFKNITAIKEALNEHDIVNGLYDIKHLLDKVVEFNPELQKYQTSIENAYYEMEDFENVITRAKELEFDENRLNELNARMSLISDIKRRYQKDVPELLDYLKELDYKVNNFELYDLLIEEARQKVILTYEQLKTITLTLTKKRQVNAEGLKKNIQATLQDLCLDKVQLEIVFKPYDLTNPFDSTTFKSNGADVVDIMISFNYGEPLKELSKVASGGEMSRIMLAFKTHILTNMHLSTMIFDEIDTGVSGEVAHAIAEKMQSISKTTQVLAITHLPMVTAAADEHMFIAKEVSNNRTVTSIRKLNYEERIEEIAKMISSSKTDITAQRLAEDMINNFKKK